MIDATNGQLWRVAYSGYGGGGEFIIFFFHFKGTCAPPL
jgi:hypothetical protein